MKGRRIEATLRRGGGRRCAGGRKAIEDVLPAIVDLRPDVIEQRRDLAGRYRAVVDSLAEPEKPAVLASKLSGVTEDQLPVDGLSRVRQFGLHVDAEEILSVAGET